MKSVNSNPEHEQLSLLSLHSLDATVWSPPAGSSLRLWLLGGVPCPPSELQAHPAAARAAFRCSFWNIPQQEPQPEQLPPVVSSFNFTYSGGYEVTSIAFLTFKYYFLE